MHEPDPRLDDDAVVIAKSREEPEWFSVIFDRYYGAIHRYAAARLGSDVASDVAAETFLIAFDRRTRYDLTCDQARPWLYGIATNLIGRHRRSEVRFYRAMARAGTAEPDGGHADRVTERVAAERLSPELARGLAGMSRGDRDALLLVACAGFSYAEAARALGVAVGTVSSRVNRARRKLRALLGPTAREVFNHG
ncbi:RNA polymerase sigma factor [Nonomuraea sp. NPDC050540]|uniref:RNA polymerase sigma factor n=2 Tax=Nonomuraea TaxID=83681 RepID=UPI0037B7B5C8